MKLCVFVALVAVLASVSSAKESVVTLTTKNFDSIVMKEDFIVVEFYAPWCGHCKNLAPEYEKAASQLLKEDPPIILAKVDATEEPDLGNKYGVRGYPTIKIFRNGEESEYEGPRDAAGIVSYVKKQSGPASRTLASDEEAEKMFSKATDLIVLGLFADLNSAKYQAFLKTANQMREQFTFAESALDSLMSKFDLSDGVVIVQPAVYQSKLETMTVKTNEIPSSVTLKSWINKNSLPLVGALTEDTSERYDAAKKPTLTLWANIDYKLDAKGSNYVANRLRKVAVNFPDVSFTVGDIRDRMGSQVVSTHGMTPSDVYAVTIKGSDGLKYAFSGLTGQEKGFKTDGLDAFVQEFLDGKVEAFIKSEDEPAQSTVKGVTTLTARTFDREVKGKDALIEFYAPWCGHCKSLAPTWDELGAKLESEDVVIAKMDATANDAPPQFEVQGFPSIYYQPANGAPEKYNGGRDLDEFLQFLNKKTTFSAKVKSEL